MGNIIWKAKKFKDLSVDEYFEVVYLRIEIFVVEQDCPYQEIDEKDRQSIHLFGRTGEGEIIAVCRILPVGVSYDEVSIGRVALKKEYRGTGIADSIMTEALMVIQTEYGTQPIRISAQVHLKNFYMKHGFKAVGEMYLEDGIPHVEMLIAR